MDFITGENREQTIMFPERIDEYVDENACVRVIDAYVDSLDICVLGFNRYKHKETGRPPYNPKEILKLYLYGYMNRIRSSLNIMEDI